ncbi:MAG TPA: hypothetical protein VNH84_01205 [Candidatus Saccharimonadales bacterium]|jgi:hypothetical protein|nr:hypothetical protein [Candidatus Saccharimonadales bacterium]
MKRLFSGLLGVAIPCLLFALAVAGCSSFSGPGSASFASVIITNHTPTEIHDAAAKVFRADGYEAYETSPNKLLFEKEASRFTTMSREGLIATQNGARTMERVYSELISLGGGAYRLQCEVFMVSNAEESFMENEVRMTNIRSGPYQSLLDKVAKQLK